MFYVSNQPAILGAQRGAGAGGGTRSYDGMRAAGNSINYGVAGAQGMGYAGMAAPFAAAGGAEALGTAKNPIVTMQVMTLYDSGARLCALTRDEWCLFGRCDWAKGRLGSHCTAEHVLIKTNI